MKKSIQLLSLIFTLTLVLSIFASAAGESTTSRVDTQDYEDETETSESEDDSVKEETTQETSEDETEKSRCDSLKDREERIKCRLIKAREYKQEKREADYESTELPESCMRLAEKTGNKVTTKEECRRLYNSLQPCYSMSGIEKPRCFREKAGLSGAALKSGEPEKVRHYIVALLYDIQERIEEQNEKGTITDDKAAEIIDLILEIKENLMNGETREIIKPKMQQLKSLLQETREVTANE
jgi:hypothetical protein